jgi:hypothetical protein
MILNGNLTRDINQEQTKVVISERKALFGSLNQSMDEGYKERADKRLTISIKKNTTTETAQMDLLPYLRYTIGDLKRIMCAAELEAGK